MSTLARPTPVYFSSARRPSAVEQLATAIREIAGWRELVRQLALADMRRAGAHTIIGNVWWVLDPLFQMPLYVLLVGVVLRSGTVDYPLFLFSAVLPWKWFTSGLTDATMSVSSRDQLIKQVAFPKIILPVSAIVASTPQFFIGFIPLLVMMGLFYRSHLSAYLLFVPLVAAVQFVFMVALGVLIAICHAFARETGRLTGYVFRAWFFLSPALYSLDRIEHVTARHPALGYFFRLNPFTTLFDAYRAAIYDARMPNLAPLAVLLAASLALFCGTALVFKRLEPRLPKIL
jgi:ABC-type polysaccharide/polyol phosphate export permease